MFFSTDMYVQEQLKIVGPVRFRSIHTKSSDCAVNSSLSNCYY